MHDDTPPPDASPPPDSSPTSDASPTQGRAVSEPADAVWRALANATRRAILDLLFEGPRTTGELAEHFDDLSRFAVMQHLKVLEEAHLVVARKDGRRRFNYLNPVPIQQVYDRWVSRFMQPWTEALVGLKHELEEQERRG